MGCAVMMRIDETSKPLAKRKAVSLLDCGASCSLRPKDGWARRLEYSAAEVVECLEPR